MSREELKKHFLSRHGWETASVDKIPGDASFRKYERLQLGDTSRILMDAPPEKENVVPFIHVATFLRTEGLNAPEIVAADEEHGFLLLEDFGNHSYSKVLAGKTPLGSEYSEIALYEKAIDALVTLHATPCPASLPAYDEALLLKEAMLLLEWYYPALHDAPLPELLQNEYIRIWKQLLPFLGELPSVVVLRDYHADNLMWLPERSGTDKVGLLDFQDAVIGSPVYDIVSLLEDARRDVDSVTVDAMINRYLQARPDITRKNFLASYAILGAQRNCKIVGIFSRLAVRDHNSSYLALLSRVWKHIDHDLTHPLLMPLKEWFRKVNNPQAASNGASVRA